MTNINDRKIKDLERSVFTIKVTSALSRFFVDDNLYEEINERWIYINEMYNSLEKYSTLYNTTGNSEYRNMFENNYASAYESIEEQKTYIYSLYPLSSLLFLENIKNQFRDGFYIELINIISQFKTSKDLSEYICYHGSLDLNNIIDYVLTRNISTNYISLFEQIKNKKIITYKKEEWLSIGTKLNSCLLEIKTKEKQDMFVDKYINKLTSYRFLLTVFAYDF